MVIQTITANCQDCYRCVRVCPVGAIRVEGGQAGVDEVLCVQCGTCVRECPQGAKRIRGDLGAVKALIEDGAFVAASVAPSFAAVYPGWQASRLPAALRMLGFSSVSECAEGAKAVAEASAEEAGATSITACCPAVVSYIEKYRPEILPLVMPIVSPMVAHGRMLKARHGKGTKVVFIGPCAAKKAEAAAYPDAVDAVLTFDELSDWLTEEDISLSTCLESGFETYGNLEHARLFPLEGGLLRTAGIEDDPSHAVTLRISGAKDVMELLDTPRGKWPYDIVEPLFCRGGCVGGPCMPKGKSVFAAMQEMIAYSKSATAFPGDSPKVDLKAVHAARPLGSHLPAVSEARIQEILAETGKDDPSQQLNCGACGYDTCRENAIAVARGMAEPGMCISYVRKKAERRADHIIKNSPNGIVVVDRDLIIVDMNARFLRMFDVPGGMVGRPVSSIVDPEGFERLLGGAEGTQEAIRTREGMKYQELIFTLPGEHELTGIYVDVSSSTFNGRQVDLIKDQSLRHARDLLAHQIRFSQEMAHFLGKSTAQTEELVKRLMDMYAEDDAP